MLCSTISFEDIVESVSTWNELRAFGDTPTELKNCVAAFRRTFVYEFGAAAPHVRCA